MGFEETNNKNFDTNGRSTIGSRGFWRAKREHDNHSHLTTHFRHPKHIKYNCKHRIYLLKICIISDWQ